MASYAPKKISSGAIATRSKLCAALDISIKELEDALNLPADDRYGPIRVPQLKKDGSVRAVLNPCSLIRKIQRRLNRRIFSEPSIIAWPDHIYGSVPSTSTRSTDYFACATKHCLAKSVASLDIQDFFTNIGEDLVYRVFNTLLDMDDSVASALTNICCHNGHLVQGALTSSYLASLCLFEDEGRVVKRLESKGLVYTRLVDDITISSKVANFNFEHPIRVVEEMLRHRDLPLNTAKTRIQYASSAALTVHGLRVAFPKPRLPSDEVKRIRSAVRHLEVVASEVGYRTTPAYRHDFNRCIGRVNKLKRVGHNQFSGLLEKVQDILPLPSRRDIPRCIERIERLEREYSSKRDTYGYFVRYYIIHERLGILKRSFPVAAAELRARWRMVKPVYE